MCAPIVARAATWWSGDGSPARRALPRSPDCQRAWQPPGRTAAPRACRAARRAGDPEAQTPQGHRHRRSASPRRGRARRDRRRARRDPRSRRKRRSPGRKAGPRCPSCPGSRLVSCAIAPPAAEDRNNGLSGTIGWRIAPSAPHASPAGTGAAAIVRTTSVCRTTTRTLASAKKPTPRPSGDQNGNAAWSVPAIGRADDEARLRSHRRGTPPGRPRPRWLPPTAPVARRAAAREEQSWGPRHQALRAAPPVAFCRRARNAAHRGAPVPRPGRGRRCCR